MHAPEGIVEGQAHLMAAVDWRSLAEQAHAAVDEQFGEPIRIIPWKASDYSAGAPDPERPTVDIVGSFAVQTTKISEAAGQVGRGGDFLSRIVEADMWIAVRRLLVAIAKPRKGDRIQFLRRGWMCEITYLEPRKTDRVVIHMVRV